MNFRYLHVIHLLAMVLIAAGAPGCGQQPRTPQGHDAARPDSGRLIRHHVTAEGEDRSFLAYVPPTLQERPAALLVLHGAGGDGGRIRTFIGRELERLARLRGYLVLYPDGHGGHWNDCRSMVPYPAKRAGVDDASFVRALIRWAREEYGVAAGGVWAMGFSNGGHLAFRLALELPDEVPAVAAFGASLPEEEELDCRASGRPASVMVVNGTEDLINPFEGGSATGPDDSPLGRVRSSHATVRHFAALAGHADTPPTERWIVGGPGRAGVKAVRWPRCGSGEVILYEVVGGGHTIPDPHAAFPDFLGPVERRFNAVEAAVHFFERQEEADPC
jgi:polyhydroxybutyrate depolymerase